MEDKPKIIFIIGMHRCGTSLLSNCLIENGFSIGKTKNKDKDWQNPNGYFENDALHEIHNELLKFNNSDWLNINKQKMEYNNYFIDKYRNLLKTEFENDNLILIKDPRLTFFVDFLKEVCNNIYEYKFLFLTRNKIECCNSLSKAQNKPLDKTYELYDKTLCFYNESFLKIAHNDIIHNNNDILKKIAIFCNFNLINDTEDIVDLNLYRCRTII
jgi:hypothetical protein